MAWLLTSSARIWTAWRGNLPPRTATEPSEPHEGMSDESSPSWPSRPTGCFQVSWLHGIGLGSEFFEMTCPTKATPGGNGGNDFNGTVAGDRGLIGDATGERDESRLEAIAHSFQTHHC
jgi:hypothetical protein